MVTLSSGSLSCAAALSRGDLRLCKVNAFASSLVTSCLPEGQGSWMAHLRHNCLQVRHGSVACRYDMGRARPGQSCDSKSGMQGKMKSGSISSLQEFRVTVTAWLSSESHLTGQVGTTGPGTAGSRQVRARLLGSGLTGGLGSGRA